MPAVATRKTKPPFRHIPGLDGMQPSEQCGRWSATIPDPMIVLISAVCEIRTGGWAACMPAGQGDFALLFLAD